MWSDVSYFGFYSKSRKLPRKNKAKRILKEAEQAGEHLKKQRLLEAKEKFLQMKAEYEKEAKSNVTIRLISARIPSVRKSSLLINGLKA